MSDKVTIPIDIDLAPLQSALQGLSKSLQGMDKEVKKVAKSADTKKVQEDIKRVGDEAQKATTKATGLKGALEKLKGSKFGKELGLLKTSFLDLGNSMGLPMSQMGGFASQLGKTTLAAGPAGVAIAGVTASMVAYGKSMGLYAGIENEMTSALIKLRGSMTDVSVESQKVKDSVSDLAKNSKFSELEVTQGLNGLATAGLSAADSLNVLPAVLQGATASGASMENTTAILTDSLAVFGLASENATDVIDTLAFTASNSKTTMEDLGAGIKNVGPVAKELGLSVEEVSNMIGIMGDKGIQGAEAGTALRAAFQGLAGASAGSKKAMDELGISMQNADGTMKSSVEISKELADKLADSTPQEKLAAATKIAGQTGSAALLTMINEADKIEESLQKVQDGAKGYSKTVADEMAQTVEGLQASLGSSIQALQKQMVEASDRQLKSLLKLASSMTDMFTPLAQVMGQIVGVIMEIGRLVMAVIKPVIAIIMSLFNGLKKAIDPILEAISDVIDVFEELGKIIEDTIVPILDVVVDVIAGVLVSAFQRLMIPIRFTLGLFQIWGEHLNKYVLAPVMEVVDYWKRTWLPAFEAIGSMFVEIGNIIKQYVIDSFNKLKESIDNLAAKFRKAEDETGKFRKALDKITDTILKIRDTFGILGIFLRMTAENWKEFGIAIKEDAENWPSDIKRALTKLLMEIEITFKSIPSTVSFYLEQMLTMVKGYFGAIGDMVSVLWQSIKDWDFTDLGSKLGQSLQKSFNKVKNESVKNGNKLIKSLNEVREGVEEAYRPKFEDIITPNPEARERLKNLFGDTWKNAYDEYYRLKKEADEGDIAAQQEIIDNYGEMEDALYGVGNAAQDTSESVMEIAKSTDIWRDALDGVKKISDNLGKIASNWGLDILRALETGFASVSNVILDLIDDLKEPLTEAMEDVDNAIEEVTVSAEEMAKKIGKAVAAIGVAITAMSTAITRAIFQGQREAMDQRHKEEKEALDRSRDEWEKYWKDLENMENGRNDDKLKELQERLSLGLITEQQYREEKEAMDQEDAEREKERNDLKAEQEEALRLKEEELEAKQRAEKNELEKKAFDAEKANNIASTIAATALGIMTAFSAGPIVGPVMAGIIGAMGAAQVAVIASQKFIPKYVSGTAHAQGGMAMVGEAGPELVYLPKGSEVKTAGQTRNILGQDKPNITININSPIYGVDQLDRVINKSIDQALTRAATFGGA